MKTSISDRRANDASEDDWLEVVRQQASHLRFGSIQITVHDGQVTQVESIEKTRFIAPRNRDAQTK